MEEEGSGLNFSSLTGDFFTLVLSLGLDTLVFFSSDLTFMSSTFSGEVFGVLFSFSLPDFSRIRLRNSSSVRVGVPRVFALVILLSPASDPTTRYLVFLLREVVTFPPSFLTMLVISSRSRLS